MNELLEEVNRVIRDLAAKLDPEDALPMWQFVCECGEKSCTERVGLSAGRYDALKNADVALLAPGHRSGRPGQ
ncbi:MAG TPA: hypothetical protein VF094_06205 [Gaiellaceae bacterium]